MATTRHQTDYDKRRDALFLYLQSWPRRNRGMRVGGYLWRFDRDCAISGNVIVMKEDWHINHGKIA